jgi:hypothetical protein
VYRKKRESTFAAAESISAKCANALIRRVESRFPPRFAAETKHTK